MDTSQLIQTINSLASSPSLLEESQRAELLSSCKTLEAALENPLDRTMRLLMAPCEVIFLRLAIDMGLIDAALSFEGHGATAEQLASKTGVDILLVFRIARAMVGMGLFKEVEDDKYVPTSAGSTYSTQSPLAQAVIHMTTQLVTVVKLPDYFEAKGFKNPDNAYDGPFQYAHATKLHSFDWIAAKPRIQHAFNIMMTQARRNALQPWFEYFPVAEKLRANSPSDPLLVDIGGGVGHDLVALKKKNPDLSGKLILQDIPVVIESAQDLPEGIDAMKHDMFTAQPIKGAKAYFLRNVLHDWPDKQSLTLLGHIRDAMDSESRVLVNESVMPEKNAPLYNSIIDLNMMAGLSALERTEKQFIKLLEDAGLQVVRVWAPENALPGSAKLFEAIKR